MRTAAWLFAAFGLAHNILAQRTPEPSLVSVVIDFQPSSQRRSQLILDFTRAGATAELKLPNGERVAAVTWDGATAKRKLDEMWDALGKSPQTFQQEAGTGQRDGTRYDVQIKTLKADVRLSLLDEEAQNRLTGIAAIVRWANAVRLDVAK